MKITRVLRTLEGGRTAFQFRLSDVLLAWWEDSRLLPEFTCQTLGQHYWPELTADEIREQFGPLPLSPVVELGRDDYAATRGIDVRAVRDIRPGATKAAIRRASLAVVEWIRGGVDCCDTLASKRGVRQWVWRRAEADTAGGPLRPAK